MDAASGREEMTQIQGGSPTSVITIDPIIAKEIVSIAHESPESSASNGSKLKSREAGVRREQQNGSRTPSPRVGTSPRTPIKARARTRSNSLRHVKNSNEMLRQRSKRVKPMDLVSETSPNARGGRQFTVGSVGNNGMIYLR